MIEQKQCIKCLAIKAVAEFDKGRAVCKVCRNEQNRKYRSANREKINEYQRKYKAANREQLSEYQRKNYAANREQISEHHRKYKAANREQINQQTLIRSLDPAKLAELKTKLEKL